MGVRNPLSEFDSRPSTRFREALSEADDFIRRADGYAEAQVRVQELTETIRQIKELHTRVSGGGLDMCFSCVTDWPCPTMKLIEGEE